MCIYFRYLDSFCIGNLIHLKLVKINRYLLTLHTHIFIKNTLQLKISDIYWLFTQFILFQIVIFYFNLSFLFQTIHQVFISFLFNTHSNNTQNAGIYYLFVKYICYFYFKSSFLFQFVIFISNNTQVFITFISNCEIHKYLLTFCVMQPKNLSFSFFKKICIKVNKLRINDRNKMYTSRKCSKLRIFVIFIFLKKFVIFHFKKFVIYS